MILSTDAKNALTFTLVSPRYRRFDARISQPARCAVRANPGWSRVCWASIICLAAFATFPGPAVAIDLNAGRVVHYSFDSYISGSVLRYVRDDSGLNNHGMLVNFNSPLILMTGHRGNGFSLPFDRARKQRIDVGTGTQPSLDLTRFTIAAWIRITESDTEEKTGRSRRRTTPTGSMSATATIPPAPRIDCVAGRSLMEFSARSIAIFKYPIMAPGCMLPVPSAGLIFACISTARDAAL